MPRRLVIRVQADGSVQAETVGISGEACLEYASVVEDLCAAQITDRTFTAETTRDLDDDASLRGANVNEANNDVA